MESAYFLCSLRVLLTVGGSEHKKLPSMRLDSGVSFCLFVRAQVSGASTAQQTRHIAQRMTSNRVFRLLSTRIVWHKINSNINGSGQPLPTAFGCWLVLTVAGVNNNCSAVRMQTFMYIRYSGDVAFGYMRACV